MVYLDHNGTVRELPLSTGKTFVVPPYFNVPRGLQVIEGFKLKDGTELEIHFLLHITINDLGQLQEVWEFGQSALPH